MLGSARITTEMLKLKAGDTALLCLPIEYIAGKMMVVRSLFAGLNLLLEEPTGTPNLEKYQRIDFCAMVPLQVHNLIETPQLAQIKTLIIGGAEISFELEEQVKELPNAVFETYGMAETCSHIALRRVNGETPDKYFKTLDGVKLELDERGCLLIQAPFLDEPVITNDLAELKNNGQFQWLGRYDNIINSGGIKIQPETLEKQIQEILHLPCAVIGLPDAILGQRIVLVAETQAKNLEIVELLKGKIDKKQIPKEVYCIEQLPRNASYKVDRVKLMEMIG